MAEIVRRLSAVMAADVVGYSRLMEADETRTLQHLKAHQAAIHPVWEEHGGRIVGTAGDGILAEFSSVVEAVNAAMRIQEIMAKRTEDDLADEKMLFRIGINLGDIIVADDGDIFGNGVNVAARLEGLASPGGLCISQSAHEQVRDHVAFEFEDGGEVKVKNISRPIHMWRWPSAFAESAGTQGIAEPGTYNRPSLAVLPFGFHSAENDRVFLADGLVDSLTTELSRFPGLEIISRGSTLQYGDKHDDPRKIAGELEVEFIVAGEIRCAGDRVRVSARLIDGSTGAQISGENFDGRLEDIFDFLDDMTQRVVAALQDGLISTRWQGKAKPRRRLTEIELHGWALLKQISETLSTGDRIGFDKLLEPAEELANASTKLFFAKIPLVTILQNQLLMRWCADHEKTARMGLDIADELIALEPSNFEGYYHRGVINLWSNRKGSAAQDLRHSFKLNPNYPLTVVCLSLAEAALGNVREGRSLAQMATRLLPRSPWIGSTYLVMAMCEFLGNDWRAFHEWTEKAVTAQPWAPYRRVLMIVWASQEGAEDVINEHANILAEQVPDFIPSLFRGENSAFVNPEHNERILNALRLAGLEPQ